MTTFKDHFSQQSDLYARYRPVYPKALFTHLNSLTPNHDLAWDCGTGNGQAATLLAGFYKHVIATDPSEAQIKNTVSHPGVTFCIEKAERTSLVSKSVDLITVANALHWFDFDLFYKEANRVMKPDGIIAVWCYQLPCISPEIDAIIRHFHDVTLNEYWLPENRLVEKGYQTVPFPFETIESPPFFCEMQMTPQELIGYLNTWSATQRYINKNGANPTIPLTEKLLPYWESPGDTKKVTWDLTLKIGKIHRP